LAREFAEHYRSLSPEARQAFFLSLLDADFLPDPRKVISAAERYRGAPNSETLACSVPLSHSVKKLFRRINSAPGGTLTLVAIREDLLKILPEHAVLKPVDSDLRHLFSSWFNRGFLRVERADWRTPAVVLGKLIEHKATHEISGWDDLMRRLPRDRRCFAFFHPALPDKPLVFIEVPLTHGLPSISCVNTD
jgi:malonyl-CoA decarboxylase